MSTFLDLFAGVGGLSLGLGLAGFKAVGASDAWADAADTFIHNHPGVPFELTRIEELTKERLVRWLPADPEWVVGGPPCQGYSTVGKRIRADDRNRLFLEFVRVVGYLRPAGFMLENVLGLKDMRFTDEVARVFSDQGYCITVFVVSAADFGVPQLRRRVLFIGHREQGFFQGPWGHVEAQPVTVLDAIGDLPPLSPGASADRYTREAVTEYQRRSRLHSNTLQGHRASRHPAHLVEAISYIPDGGNRTAIPAHLQPRSGFHNSYSRLASWLPAVAVTQNMGKPSGTRCIHPSQNRGLTTREGARLQSFPDRFHFCGGDTSQRLQVANAVPPELARRVGAALLVAENWADSACPGRFQNSYAVMSASAASTARQRAARLMVSS